LVPQTLAPSLFPGPVKAVVDTGGAEAACDDEEPPLPCALDDTTTVDMVVGWLYRALVPINPPVPVAEAVLLRPQLIDPPYDIGALPPGLSVEAAEGGVGGMYVEVGGGAEAPVLSVEAAEGGVGGVYVEVGSGAEALPPAGTEVRELPEAGALDEPPEGGALDEPPDDGALDEPPDDGGAGVVVFVLVLPENLPAMHFVKSGWSVHVEPLLVGVRERT